MTAPGNRNTTILNAPNTKRRSTCVGVEDPQLKQSSIMMVDDEPIIMDVLQTFLEEQGYKNFINVDDSSTALKVLHQELPDVLLLDLKMPIVDGFSILEKVRASEQLRFMPVIVLTSSSDAQTKLRALELGASDFLSKPVDASELALRLRNTLMVKSYQDRLAYFDTLTQLPNRVLFIDRLSWAIQRAGREGFSIAMMNISLDRFKEVNDSLGPRVGDMLLAQVAERLSRCIRHSDVVTRVGTEEFSQEFARSGGDEFSILLPGVSRAANASFVADRILTAIQAPFDPDGHRIYMGASIGIAVYPEDGKDADSLIKSVGAAVAFAKQHGRNRFQFFSSDMNVESKKRMEMEMALRNALEKKEFALFYQPKIDAYSGKVLGAEALIRWFSADGAVVAPGDFIPLAEETGLILSIGKWVIEEACRQGGQWRSMGFDQLKISVNVSGHQFTEDLPDVVSRALCASAMDPKFLVLEITESMLMGDVAKTIRLLNKIRANGPSFSIDDFGTGYSSLSYLKGFPIDELKIDRSFITDVPTSPDDAAIVKAIIAMAHSLDLLVVAEGVEKERQLNFLREQQCDLIQGYYYSCPLSAGEFVKFLASRPKKN